MADEWQSTTEHAAAAAPSPAKGDGWQSIDDHRERTFGERFWKATGVPDTARALFKDFAGDNPDPGILVHNLTHILGSGLEDSAARGKEAIKQQVAAYMSALTGHPLDALGHGLASAGGAVTATPFIGPAIDQFATHLEKGEIPEAMGSGMMLFGPSLLKGVNPAIAAASDAYQAGSPAGAIGAVGRGAGGAVGGAAGAIPAAVKGGIGGGMADLLLHHAIPGEIAPALGAAVPLVKGALSGAQKALAARRVALAPAAPVPEPVAPMPWRAYEYGPGESPDILGPASSPTAAAPAEAAPAPAPATVPRGTPDAAPVKVDVRSIADYSPADLKAALRKLSERRAADTVAEDFERSKTNPDPGTPPTAALDSKLAGMRDELRARDLPRDQQRGSMVEDDTPKPSMEELLRMSVEKAGAAKAAKAKPAGDMIPQGDYYHGTSAPNFDQFEGDDAYITPHAKEAGAFANNDIVGGGRGAGSRRILNVKPAAGKVKDVQGAIDAGIADDYEPHEVIAEQKAKARAEGYRYLKFKHPSSLGPDSPDFDAFVSLFPKDDLAITPKVKVKE